MCSGRYWQKYGCIVFLLHGLGYLAAGGLLAFTCIYLWIVLVYFPFMTNSLGNVFPFGNILGGVTGLFAVCNGFNGLVVGTCNRKLSRRNCTIQAFFGMSFIGIFLSLTTFAFNMLIVIIADSSDVSMSGFIGEKKAQLNAMQLRNDVYYGTICDLHRLSVIVNFCYFILQISACLFTLFGVDGFHCYCCKSNKIENKDESELEASKDYPPGYESI